jgi:5-methylcytosine-specific restriction endonuclease McrA
MVIDFGKVANSFFKSKSETSRKGFTKTIKDKVLEKQNNKCGKCKISFNKVNPQFDHKNGNHSDNSLRNCQALCANCHDSKSRRGNTKRAKVARKEKEESRKLIPDPDKFFG